MPEDNTNQPVACSNCFEDQGLRICSWHIGEVADSKCPRCGLSNGRKLSADTLCELAHRFFVWGSLHKYEYGASPVIQFNESQKTSIRVSPWLLNDVKIFENILGIRFFYYGPRLWMIGDIEPLNDLQNSRKQPKIIDRILKRYPSRELDKLTNLYRIRKNPAQPNAFSDYDSPPNNVTPHGRLDSKHISALYASENIDVCIHECRVTAEDEIFMATLRPLRSLRMLDLTVLLKEEANEFESLDLAVHMLFLAGQHTYRITRNLAVAAKKIGYDGIIYPSYFSLLHNGIMPFQTIYGISHRLFPQLQDYEQSTAIANVAIFGRPIETGRVEVKCINRLILTRVSYDFLFGPADN